MLKIKDSVDLKELEKFGDIELTDDRYCPRFNVNEETRLLSVGCEDSYYLDDQNERALLLYDLIQAGLVEKEKKITDKDPIEQMEREFSEAGIENVEELIKYYKRVTSGEEDNNQQREVKKVTKVKIFHDWLLLDFQKEINSFLNNDSIELIDIKYTLTDKNESAMIIYKVEDNKNETK